MTRVAPVLSTAGSAASITYRTGNFVSGRWTGFNFPFDVSMVGTDNTIILDTGILSRSQPFENPEVICLSFKSGNLMVKSPAGRAVFTHTLRNGLIVRKCGKFGGVDVEISTGVVPNAMVGSGSVVFFSFSTFGETADIEGGSAVVRIFPTQDPGYAWPAENWPGSARWIGGAQALALDIHPDPASGLVPKIGCRSEKGRPMRKAKLSWR